MTASPGSPAPHPKPGAGASGVVKNLIAYIVRPAPTPTTGNRRLVLCPTHRDEVIASAEETGAYLGRAKRHAATGETCAHCAGQPVKGKATRAQRTPRICPAIRRAFKAAPSRPLSCRLRKLTSGKVGPGTGRSGHGCRDGYDKGHG